jgi:hypothetical protein
MDYLWYDKDSLQLLERSLEYGSSWVLKDSSFIESP